MDKKYIEITPKDLIKNQVYYDCQLESAAKLLFVGLYKGVFVFKELHTQIYFRVDKKFCQEYNIPYSSNLVVFTSTVLTFYKIQYLNYEAN